jgi:hypothetical protein
VEGPGINDRLGLDSRTQTIRKQKGARNKIASLGLHEPKSHCW